MNYKNGNSEIKNDKKKDKSDSYNGDDGEHSNERDERTTSIEKNDVEIERD